MLSHQSWNAVVKSVYLLLFSTSVPGLPFTTCAASYQDTAMPRLSYSHSCGVVWCTLCPLSIIPRMTNWQSSTYFSECTPPVLTAPAYKTDALWLILQHPGHPKPDDCLLLMELGMIGLCGVSAPLHSSSWRANEERPNGQLQPFLDTMLSSTSGRDWISRRLDCFDCLYVCVCVCLYYVEGRALASFLRSGSGKSLVPGQDTTGWLELPVI